MTCFYVVAKPKIELFVIHQIEGVLLFSFFSLNDIEIGRSWGWIDSKGPQPIFIESIKRLQDNDDPFK